MAVRFLKNYTASHSDQVPHYPNLSPNKLLLSPPISVFPFLFLDQVKRFFHQWYLYFMIFWFSFPIPLISWEVFYWLISCLVFFFSLPIIGLGGFSPMTWPFKTHKLPYGARIFSVVFRFSSLASLIRLEGFSPGPFFPLTIPRLTELMSKEGDNYNNMTLGMESFQSGSHVTTIIQNFTLVSLTSTVMPYSVKLPLGAAVPSLLTYLISHCYVYVPAEKIFRLGIYLKLSTCQGM